jgi:hypothetical protein
MSGPTQPGSTPDPTPRDESKVPLRDLDLAIVGPHAPTLGEEAEMLLWRVGEARREIEAAHAWLDIKGAPRKDSYGGVFTVRGRMEKLDGYL